jgi:hypothetical protein
MHPQANNNLYMTQQLSNRRPVSMPVEEVEQLKQPKVTDIKFKTL